MTNLCNGMMVLHRTKETIYLRIPIELQTEIPWGCSCDVCKDKKNKNPNYKPKWDTLAVAVKPPKIGNDYAWTVHMPDVGMMTNFRAQGKINK